MVTTLAAVTEATQAAHSPLPTSLTLALGDLTFPLASQGSACTRHTDIHASKHPYLNFQKVFFFLNLSRMNSGTGIDLRSGRHSDFPCNEPIANANIDEFPLVRDRTVQFTRIYDSKAGLGEQSTFGSAGKA